MTISTPALRGPRLGPPPLRSVVRRTFIVAYREDTRRLGDALAANGCSAEVLRPSYTEHELTYSRTIRCLLNHAEAWRRAAAAEGITLVVEADFTPCRGFGDFPLPFDPTRQGDAAWAFLYSAAPRLLRCFPDGSLQGHSATPVAYVVTPRVAAWLCEYVEEELKRHGDLTQYSLWDTQFLWHIMGKGGVCFMPYRNFGEHGGLPNKEHHRSGTGFAARLRFLAKLGVGRNHHADVLAAPLVFLPNYAEGRRARFLRTRLEAKIIGWLKLFSGRIIAVEKSRPFPERLRLRWLAFLRLCSLH